jgi:hypothetical protein
MKASILPLGAVPRDRVRDYLLARGLSAPLIDWKYYDAAFNRGRERGYVSWRDGRVQGFIGLIPCSVATSAGERPMVWTCDWSVEDPRRSPGIGILLLKHVYKCHDHAAAVGGSADTRAALPRLVPTYEGAAAFLHLPLRSSALIEKLEQRLGCKPRLSRSALGALPLPRRRPGADAAVRFRDGVAPEIGEMLSRPPAEGLCTPLYDAGYLDWQVGRCPGLKSFSCLAGSGGDVAGALAWTGGDRRHWRMAMAATPGGEGPVEPLLRAVAARAAAEGGSLLSTIVAAGDAWLVAALRRMRFLEGSQRWPLYLSFPEGACDGGFSRLSYLDTDLAGLF